MTRTVVYLHDVPNADEMCKWALDNCHSFVYSKVTDISDVSYKYDTVVEICFDSEEDAMWFKLKWL